MTKIKVCPECGENILHEKSKFCAYCGVNFGVSFDSFQKRGSDVSRQSSENSKFSAFIESAVVEAKKRDLGRSEGGFEYGDNEIRKIEKEKYQEGLAALIVGLGGAFMGR